MADFKVRIFSPNGEWTSNEIEKMIVSWFKDISQGGYCNFCLSSRKGEVIGDIYENPELLEVK